MFSIPDKAKINGFKRVHISRGSELFARFGKMSTNVGTSDGHVIPMNQNKLDSLDFLDAYDRMMAESEQTVDDSSANQQINDDSCGES